MKKLNVLIFIILTFFIFSSCGQKEEPQTDLNNAVNNQSLAESSNDTDVSPSVEHTIFGLYSEDEYEKYIAETTLPDWFVSYDKLSHIGAFGSVVFTEDANELKYNSYMYTLIGPNEESIALYVYHSDARESLFADAQPIISTHNSTDLRSLSDTATGVFFIGDAKYYYVLGNLQVIEWTTSDVTYVMHTSDGFSGYSSGNSFIESMLNKNEVISAIAQFDKKINSSQ